MRSMLSLLFALAALCSSAIAATPITLTTGNVHADSSSDESQSHSRTLLGTVGKYAQCGGKGMGGKAEGKWANCPAGYYCKKQDYWWWSCQKGAGGSKKKPAPKKKKAPVSRKQKKKPAPKKKKAAPKKKTPAPKKKRTTRRGGSTRRVGGSTRFSSIGDDYQNPTQPNNYPFCENVKDYAFNGHWCKSARVTGLADSTNPDVKYGRGTVFNGPAWTQVGHCAKRLWPVDGTESPTNNGDWRQNYVKVAVSSYYTRNFGEYPCGRKLCIQIVGFDETMNPTPPSFWRELVRNGTAMPGIVYDQCPECEQDHIDLLGQYPFSPAAVDYNPYGATHNGIWSNRDAYYIDDIQKVYGVGIFKLMWGWNDDDIPCSQYF